MTRAPSVSVVVPSCNEAGTIDACLGALAAQDVPVERYEVLVVDGGSTDGTREKAEKHGVRLLHDGQRGPSGARNIGIEQARGRIVAFTDADCVPARDWVRRIVEVFEERPELGGVGGALRMPRRSLRGVLEDIHAIAHYRGTITSNVAYRRDVLLEVGGFDESLKCAEDWDLACRVRDAGHEVVHDRRPLVVHDPPELTADPLTFLRKDAWYGRNDVKAHARALLRHLQGRCAPDGSGQVVRAAGHAAWNAAWLAAIAGGAATASPLLVGVGVGGAALHAGHEVLHAARLTGTSGPVLPRMVALQTARRLFRGAGTLLGLKDLAVEAGREALLRPAGAASARLGEAAPSPRSTP